MMPSCLLSPSLGCVALTSMPPRPTNVGGAVVAACVVVVSGLPKIPPPPRVLPVVRVFVPRRSPAFRACPVVVVVVLKFRLATVVACGLLNENAPTSEPGAADTAVAPKAGGAVVGALVAGVEKLNEGAAAAVAVPVPNAGAAAGAPKAEPVVAAAAPKVGAAAVAPKAGAAPSDPKVGAADVVPKADVVVVAPNAGAVEVAAGAPNVGAAAGAPNVGAAAGAPNVGAAEVLPNVGKAG